MKLKKPEIRIRVSATTANNESKYSPTNCDRNTVTKAASTLTTIQMLSVRAFALDIVKKLSLIVIILSI
jgi:hypothetical protein